ncbi:hypothetical protein ACCAA_180003 [Candidatus Accumulibacter aalborgensis]|uniref:Uncharacterized protein n=1 Tax=Candidatus Accumulibacter aalborgensis TaxID=1860102 RepID=A0A1A8XL74_9PROT|nr:hypothetical protein ACCAA_180003 [Candidatus Accumulibacter aalborgensis]
MDQAAPLAASFALTASRFPPVADLLR